MSKAKSIEVSFLESNDHGRPTIITVPDITRFLHLGFREIDWRRADQLTLDDMFDPSQSTHESNAPVPKPNTIRMCRVTGVKYIDTPQEA